MNTSNTLEICSNIEKILEQFGNINFLSKQDLYTLIDYIRDSFKINVKEPFNVPRFFKDNFQDIIIYEPHKFNDTKIGGFLIKNKFPNKSYIITNSSKEPISTIFDFTHEMMHFLLHPEDRKYYISSSLCDIDNFEWQANEGAAELLVPYKRFIPHFVNNIKNCNSKKDYIDLLMYLSNKYVVSTAILEYRITGLKYEIRQYEKGVPIDKIHFLSKTAQEQQGIFITSYSELFKSKKIELKSIISNFSTNTSFLPTDNGSKSFNTVNIPYNKLESWSDILNYFKNTGRIMLYANLINTKLRKIDDNNVGIEFSDDISEFRKTLLSKKSNYDEIVGKINILFNKKMNVQFIANDSPKAKTSNIN